MTLSASEFLKHMQVPDEPRVYLLGCLEKRVTLYSQQIRALNLIHALTEARVLSSGARIGVVGAGAAGLTAAGGALLRGYRVVLFDEKQDPLSVQWGCDKRWVHPHIYDWPRYGSLNADASDIEPLPWVSGTASQVAKAILSRWSVLTQQFGNEMIEQHWGIRDAELIKGATSNQVRFQWNPGYKYVDFDVVILAIGFGIEKTLGLIPENFYWRDERLVQDDFETGRRYLISGTGDGGLTDLLCASIRRFQHDQVVSEFSLNPESFPNARKLSDYLEAIEQDISPTATAEEIAKYISDAYRTPAMDELSKFVDDKLKRRFNNRRVVLNGSSPYAFSIDSSILNRYLASRILKLEAADYWYGKLQADEIRRTSSGAWDITIAGKCRTFDEVIIRHGTVPALERSFPKLAPSCQADLRPRNELDQTRARRWPSGWFRSALAANEGINKVQTNDKIDLSSEVPPMAAGNSGGYSLHNPPFNVPFRPKGAGVIGRDVVLREVHAQLHSGRCAGIGQVATFQGLGGLGKTQLAVEYAHIYRNIYPGGVVWLEADSDIDSQLIRLADDARWMDPRTDHHIKLDMARQRLRTLSNVLIIFDNVIHRETIDSCNFDPSIIRYILVTSRIEQPGFPPVTLDLLDAEQSLILLFKEAGRQAESQADMEAARQVGARLAGLPLAIELAGSYLRYRTGMSWSQYCHLLKLQPRQALPAKFLSSFTNHEADLYATLRISAEIFAESPTLHLILDLLTLSGSASMSVALLTALAGQDEFLMADALALGVALRLLSQEQDPTRTDAPRYRLHRLVREVRREQMPQTEVVVWAQEACVHCGDWFQQRRENITNLPALEADIDHLRAWQENATAWGLTEQIRLCWLQAYPPYHRGNYREARHGVHLALERAQQQQLPESELLGHLWNDLGTSTAVLGQYREALEYEQKALEIRQKVLGEEHPDTARSLNHVGASYALLGDYPKALEYQEKALVIRKKLFGIEHLDTANSLDTIGSSYSSLGRYPAALAYKEQALAIRKKLLGEEHPDTAISLNSVGSSCSSMGGYHKALAYAERALLIDQKVLGGEHPDTATSLNNVGISHSALGNYQQALEYAEKALIIRQNVLGEEHPNTANSLNTVGVAYALLGNYRKALEYKEKALAILRKVLGEEHPGTAISLNSVGASYSAMGDYGKALQNAERALVIRRKLFGTDHPDTAASLNNVGVSYSSLGNYNTALAYAEQALAILAKILGVDHPDTAYAFNSVGNAYSSLGNYRKALEYEEKALAIRQKVFGEEHPSTAFSLNSVGDSYSSLGNHHKALEFKEKSLSILQMVLGEKHPDTANSLNHVGASYSSLGDYRKALEYEEKALAIRQKVFGEEHPETANSFNNVGDSYSSLGDHQRALEYKEKALAILQRVLGAEHPETANSIHSLGVSYSHLGDYRKGLECAEKALVIRQKMLGEKHPDTACSLNSVGTLYSSLGNYHESLHHKEKALEVYQQTLGQTSSKAIDVLIQIAGCLAKLNRVQVACERLNALFRILPGNHPKRAEVRMMLIKLTPPGFRKPAKGHGKTFRKRR